MTDVLKKICAQRKQDVDVAKQVAPVSALFEIIKSSPMPRGFAANIKSKTSRKETALIAEVKRASPSQGDIRANFDPTECARSYESAGATCLSVLTEPHWFKGEDPFIKTIKEDVKLPILRKDFMVDPYQIIESRALGADCVLIIMAAVEDDLAKDMIQTASDLGMNSLIEIHDQDELNRALNLPIDLLGINNRNLKTMDIDIQTSIHLSKGLTEQYTIVCESGIETHADITLMQDNGIYSFLVGTSLMRQPDLTKATHQLLGK